MTKVELKRLIDEECELKRENLIFSSQSLHLGYINHLAHMPKIRLIELFLVEAILFLLLWLWNGHVATILSLSMIAIAFSVLAISLIAELLERSKVPKLYYYWMLVIGLTPIVVGIFYTQVLGKGLEWMTI